LKWILKESDVP